MAENKITCSPKKIANLRKILTNRKDFDQTFWDETQLREFIFEQISVLDHFTEKSFHRKFLTAHTEKIRNTTRGCRLWEVKNSGGKNSSPTEVKRSFIHQNLSIFITKSMRNICQTKNSPQNQRTYI
jgi:hypothetical protein